MVMQRLKTLAFLGVLLGLVIGTASPKAVTLERTMYLTFNRPVAIPGAELAAGTYVFELASPMTSLSLVRVLSRDRRKIYLLAFTNEINRPEHMKPGQVVTLGESARGVPPPITAWFPEDSSTGRQFIYDR
jgi:hypothetical protein